MNWATSLSTGIVSLSVFWGINGYFQSMGWAPGSRLISNWWGRHERGTVYGLYTFAPHDWVAFTDTDYSQIPPTIRKGRLAQVIGILPEIRPALRL